jgi:hypothetical protein
MHKKHPTLSNTFDDFKIVRFTFGTITALCALKLCQQVDASVQWNAILCDSIFKILSQTGFLLDNKSGITSSCG